ncbi:MarR family transcriptional regulator [Mobilitalea sibirica]|uniref:MarR family transcriptional regulator n=1 Tax=Mobilitalea sibirica TaxID=1462919 RepID=A0A8J7KWZ4_9FIRM|nr:MarR family transcriptional regulator [Mobilitalea sibirica]MBH1941127.1 MarR family transcriptional regulator [Mobilitalea sibirica]
MLEKEFEKLYYKFRANYCKNLFAKVNSSKDGLSATESYCLEVIFLLDHPSVHEFAEYIHISMPNATYRINQLIKKGYVRKDLSEKDKREYHLEVTDKFLKEYGANTEYNARLMSGIKEKFSKEEVEILEKLIKKIVDEIMI